MSRRGRRLPDAVPAGAIAVGWATVEADRAAVELAPLLAPGAGFAEAPGSETLGASCRIGRAAGPGPRWIVLLEPATEGRLAASLARHGEGWIAAWWARGRAGDGGDAAEAAATWSASRPGPFGPERLQVGGPLAGPHRLRLDGDTIEP